MGRSFIVMGGIPGCFRGKYCARSNRTFGPREMRDLERRRFAAGKLTFVGAAVGQQQTLRLLGSTKESTTICQLG